MRILLTNDDGPPSAHASPYISTLVSVLRSPPHNHEVSVILPSVQRSWIGKAHILPASVYAHPSTKPLPGKPQDVTEHITPQYYDHTTGDITSTPPTPASSESDIWILVPGTPATCVQLGLFHPHLLFPSSSTTAPPNSTSTAPFDLVLSGPNYGRNTSAAFALSSGTLGGALEAAVCDARAIALSFAFFTRRETAETVEEACRLGARIVERLCADWDRDNDAAGAGAARPDVYNVNVPLVPGVSERPVRWTWMLDNKGRTASLYEAVDPPSADGADAEADGEEAGEEAGEHTQTQTQTQPQTQPQTQTPPSFKWAPAFGEIWKVIEASAPGNDALTMREQCSSITPLMANYASLFGSGRFEGEFKL